MDNQDNKETRKKSEESLFDISLNEQNIVDISLFIKIGIFVLSVLLIIGISIKIIPDAVSVASYGTRQDLPIYSVDTEEKKIALSFDTAWSNEDTDVILGILAKYNVKSTFFMTGEWVSSYPEDVKKIVVAGHDLGNHSENHKHMSQLTEEECAAEILSVHKKVKDLTNIDMFLFRPPYGDYSNTVIGTARNHQYYSIQWDVDVYATT